MGVEILHAFVDLSPEVAEAISQGLPLVALETTVVTHGLPFPYNLQAMEEMEKAVREWGAVPAAIGVIRGRLRIGLSKEDLNWLAEGKVEKATANDLAAMVTKGQSAGLTVSGTLAASRLLDIPILATGGIGGVHRGGWRTWDVSRDLYELSRTQAAVVCSGVKILCDVALTLELLESLGIGVVGFQTDTFPYFYLRSSGLPISTTMADPKEIANLLLVRRRLHQQEGILVVQPLPEDLSLERSMVEEALRVAERNARAKGIRGKALTPFLLQSLHALTSGATVQANLALLSSNARLAAQIASALADLRR
ncbi:MAG: pseudouridine-5'-phosphate glycosidase [Armatimonadota bacterium]|nr:pseudouridine-5'-phosphate glycosidase [Armatimonadota bacterium]MDR5702452.1 pseudouridine-5'-phosphate glycosidase [Armatimonadota bacterium]MDR7434309.1 pseudouridine-5'-phosphate glycosidase [Armatimonadota bacterium]